jgi:hypothetical protein
MFGDYLVDFAQTSQQLRQAAADLTAAVASLSQTAAGQA